MSCIFNTNDTFSLSAIRVRALFVWLGVLMCVSVAQNTFAATFTVTRSDDRNAVCNSGVDCSLREAVNAANVGFINDTINFAAGLSVITLAAEIEIIPAGSLTVSGAGANVVTIDGGAGTNRLFYLSNANVVISGVTMQGGNGVGTPPVGTTPGVGDVLFGGAIFSVGGNLVLNSVVLQDNGGTFLIGGGVSMFGGTHRIINSTFSRNTSNQCGGFYFSGAAFSMVNSTISGNTSATTPNGTGGGGGFCSNGPATVRNSTVTDNSSTGVGSGAGGVFITNGVTLDIGNTIIAGNSGLQFPDIRNIGTIISAGNNLIGDSAGDSANTSTPITYQPSDILDTPPQLGALTIFNGGATPTHALLSGSPAIDKGGNALAVDPSNNSALTTDQRGSSRVFDGDGNNVATVDIGAFERQVFAPTAAEVTIGGRVTTANGRGIRSARITLMNADGETRIALSGAFGYFRFANVPAGETYLFTVFAKRYQFDAPTRLLSVNGETDDLIFVALEDK
jgi:CSLREA domain-containing protein